MTSATAAPRELVDHAERISPAAYWELLMNLTKREVKGRYSQSRRLNATYSPTDITTITAEETQKPQCAAKPG